MVFNPRDYDYLEHVSDFAIDIIIMFAVLAAILSILSENWDWFYKCLKRFTPRFMVDKLFKQEFEGTRADIDIKYYRLVENILEFGSFKEDRTGTGTISLFGYSERFDLRNNRIPLLTTKKMFWKGIVEELLWFIRGETDSNLLSEKGVHIWDANGSKEFIEKRGIKGRRQGDLGPVYGFQWRHFGAEYTNADDDYTEKGIDQLAKCIDQIKNNPDSRRIIMTAWNPKQLDQMNLPPCHLLVQFYVNNGELSCSMYQRSADVGLGVPFNIASYSLLTHIIAKKCGLTAREFVYNIGDAHIYINHKKKIKEQMKRIPYFRPSQIKLKIDKETPLDKIRFEDIKLIGYMCHPAVKLKMAV